MYTYTSNLYYPLIGFLAAATFFITTRPGEDQFLHSFFSFTEHMFFQGGSFFPFELHGCGEYTPLFGLAALRIKRSDRKLLHP